MKVPPNGIFVYSICPLFLLVIVGYGSVTSIQRLPATTAEVREDKNRDVHHQHKSQSKNQHWLPKIAHQLSGFSPGHHFNWLHSTKHLSSFFTMDESEPEMAGSESGFSKWKANNWRPRNHHHHQHNPMSLNNFFDDSNNFLHEFFASETQHQRRPNRQFHRPQKQQQKQHRPLPMMFSRKPMFSHPRPPIMNSGGGNRHFNHHHHHHHQQQQQHSFQGMQSFVHQSQFHQHQHQQQNFMFPPMHSMHQAFDFNSGGGSGFEEGSEGNPIKGAVISHHQEQQVYNVPGQFQQQHHEPTVVHVEGNVYPITLSWNSFSSPIMEEHHSEGGYSHAELVSHTHHKPIYHEVHQMDITPFDNWHYHHQPHQPPLSFHRSSERRSQSDSMNTTTAATAVDSRHHEYHHHYSDHTRVEPK